MSNFTGVQLPQDALQGMAQIVEMLIPDGQSLRHPFWEFHWGQVGSEAAICSIVLFFSGILCSAAGIGGGGVYVVVLMLFGELTPHNAVPLSKAVVFFGSIASLMVNLNRMKTDASAKPVIDIHACRLTIPAALIGTFIGVLANWHANGSCIVLLLTLLLCFMSCLVIQTAMSQRTAELGEKAQSEGEESELEALLQPSPDAKLGTVKTRKPSSELTRMDALQKSTSETALGVATNVDVAVSIVLMVLVVLCGILRFHMHACREEKEGITRPGSCDHPVVQVMGPQMDTWLSSKGSAFTLQFLVYGIPFVACASLMLGYARSTQQLAGWSSSRIVKYQVVSVLTGALAGLVGVGGGLVFSPFFLLTGMEPAVAIGTSSTIVLFIASSTSIQYVFTDRVIMPLAFIYGIVTLVASYAGTKLVHVLQDHFSARRSYLTFIVALGVGLSAVLSFVKLARMMGVSV
mmetsp:Transcript_11828/g.26374  ORF Transcript_11828/g.26374 Transcript_11828/m.26374 type:complete len:462 (-) Transcript_11828:172-1557(-)